MSCFPNKNLRNYFIKTFISPDFNTDLLTRAVRVNLFEKLKYDIKIFKWSR